jgi:tetratricopeptide (TPR) repeat protein
MNETATQAANAGWRELLATGQYGAAARAHQRLLLTGADPTDAEFSGVLALLAQVERHNRRKAYRAALAALDEAAELAPRLLPWSALRTALEAVGQAGQHLEGVDFDHTLATLQAIEGDFWKAERLTLEGTFVAQRGEGEAAMALFESALVADPDHVRALTNRGNLRLNQGDVEGAVADYRRAIAVDEGFANAHHNLGVALRRQGKIAASVAALRKAQKLALQNDSARLRQARTGARPQAANRAPWWSGRIWWWALVALLLGWAIQQGLF